MNNLAALQELNTVRHTPAPWRCEAQHGPGQKFLYFLIRTESNDWIASTWAGQSEAEHRANGALIAAAPDLLAACKKSLRWMMGERECHYDAVTTSEGEYTDEEDRMAIEQYDRDIDELQALIDRAEGKS